MGKKLYTQTKTGGIKFASGRKPGEVRIPNYVYDLWLPLIGTDAIAVYAVYCRLEREDVVKSITLDTMAKCCRIGKASLYKINAKLQECGFIEVKSPKGNARAHHHTTEITVKDPPQEVSAKLIEKYQAESGYEPLSKWLVGDHTDVLSGTSRSSIQNVQDVPTGTSTMLQPSVLQPSSVADASPSGKKESDKLTDMFIKAWLDGQSVKPVSNQYGIKSVRADALAIATAGYTTDQVTSYVKGLAGEAYWSKKLVSMRYVANNIAAHYAAHKPAATIPAHQLIQFDEPDPDAVPMPQEAIDALALLVSKVNVKDEVLYVKRPA